MVTLRLRDENTASEILRMSRQLRLSEDTDVAEHVFINPDLTVAAEVSLREKTKATTTEVG